MLAERMFLREGEPIPKAKHGYSRDKRFDCRQLVIALVITPQGFPLAYEVLAGNTSERTTRRGFLHKIEATYGKARRVWLMDRGIPREEVWAEMRDRELEHRVEAHILVAFLAYGLLVTLKNRLPALAPGLTPQAVLEKLAGIEMLDVCFPTTDGRRLVMPRYTQPDPDQQLLLPRLKLALPPQPPPRLRVRSIQFAAEALRLSGRPFEYPR